MTEPDYSKLEEARAKAAEIRAKGHRSAEKMALVRGKATSADGSVVVEVNASGQLTDLRLADKALALGAARLAHQIRATAIAATQNTAEARAEALAELTEGMADSERLARFREFIPPLPSLGPPGSEHPDTTGAGSAEAEDEHWDTGQDRFVHRDDEE
ncbi:MAG: YbaB/EbfC family nucleoid-associated protein [Segniliparus sp.]|uniref:YbaB/EbfC family nucleoid-associated protein n=1 Tax=Segniliparus sp. TaxID=2804064 RepID=UPI003F35C9C7